MFRTLNYILPILLPSWRFFQTIEPSPRVQWRVIRSDSESCENWHEYHLRPETISPFQQIIRLFFNPQSNDALFVTSCAERIREQVTQHSIDEINRRIAQRVGAAYPNDSVGVKFQFRLLSIQRDDQALTKQVIYESQHCALSSVEGTL